MSGVQVPDPPPVSKTLRVEFTRGVFSFRGEATVGIALPSIMARARMFTKRPSETLFKQERYIHAQGWYAGDMASKQKGCAYDKRSLRDLSLIHI